MFKTSQFTIAVTLILTAGMINTSHATILQFDQMRDPTNTIVPTVSGNQVEQDYGDAVSGAATDAVGGQFTYGNGGEGFTPNVSVEYFAGAAAPNNPAMNLWQNGYGDLTNVLFGNNNSQSLNILLTADPGYQLDLYHFDLAGWGNRDYLINSVQVLSSDTVLFAQNDVLVEGNASGPLHTAFDFSQVLSASQLHILIDYSNLVGSSQDNIGIDNIQFGQNPPPPPSPSSQGNVAVPAPPTFMLFITGLLMLSIWRRPRINRI